MYMPLGYLETAPVSSQVMLSPVRPVKVKLPPVNLAISLSHSSLALAPVTPSSSLRAS